MNAIGLEPDFESTYLKLSEEILGLYSTKCEVLLGKVGFVFQ